MSYMKMNAIKMKREMGLQPLPLSWSAWYLLCPWWSVPVRSGKKEEGKVAQKCACSKTSANSGDGVKNRIYCSLWGKNNYISVNSESLGRHWECWELRSVSSVHMGGGMELVRNTGYILIGILPSLIQLI